MKALYTTLSFKKGLVQTRLKTFIIQGLVGKEREKMKNYKLCSWKFLF